jgi:adenosylcobinamide-phosphate synthase
VSRRRVLLAAYLLDWIAGDPEWLPHPVRLMGKCIEQGEQRLRRNGQRPAVELLTGGALAFSLVAVFYFVTSKTIQWSYKRGRRFGFTAETILAWTCLASRSLQEEASAVLNALDGADIVTARQRLARIVGRDTQYLEVQEISRAVIETVAESASDGVVAPLFYMGIGGVPLAMAYKTINTLDSMIGHNDPKYFYFGKMAARLDDVANFLPSRLTALSIATVAGAINGASSSSALSTWLRDGNKHKSPNAGQPESSMAGALRVRLGGNNSYRGEIASAPLLGERFSSPSPQQAKQAIRIVTMVSVLGVAVALLLRRRRT